MVPSARVGLEVDTVANRPFVQAYMRPMDVQPDGPAIFPRATAAGGLGNIKVFPSEVRPTEQMLQLQSQMGTFVGQFNAQAQPKVAVPDYKSDADTAGDGTNALIIAGIGIVALVGIIMLVEYNR